MAKILLLDDEPHTRRVIELHLGKQGHDVTSGGDGQEGLATLSRETFDLIITDLRMPKVGGMELLKEMGERGIATPVIVLTAFTSIETAVDAMKLGAADYIGKPPQLDEITLKVNNLLNRQTLVKENQRLRKELRGRFNLEGIVGRSEAIKGVLEQANTLARDRDISVLLIGESGTGKEMVARAIHYNSPRANGPFVPINCGALTEALLESELFGHERGAFTGAMSEKKGLLELAHCGTLFLDEVSAMPAAMQVKLLRALEQKEIRRVGGTRTISVDIRVVSASNQDLERLVEEKSFRADLYYRLAVATIFLPPLRVRRGDVPLLISHFLETFNEAKGKKLTFASEAIALLEAYPWPGNVRELEHLIELLTVTLPSGDIKPERLPDRYKKLAGAAPEEPESEESGDNLKTATKNRIAKFEREFIGRQLEKHRWNVSRTAQAIGLSRAALHAKMKEYGIGNN
jgi:DNA-binding NtrC family response regulator